MVSFRKCVACGEMKKKDELFRIVRTEGSFEFDPSQKMSRRGAYICRSEECLKLAVKKKSFSKSFHQAVNEEAFINNLYEALNDSF